MYSNAQKYKPAVLQNESHPYLQEKDLRNFCDIHDIAFQVSSHCVKHKSNTDRLTPRLGREIDLG